MCGRFAITLPPDAVRAFFRYIEQPNFPPRYNIAPTQPVPVIRSEGKPDGGRVRHFVLVRWGFLPAFVKDPKDFPLVINARSETILDKPSFRNAMRRRRCILIADAFYEWRRDRSATGKGKVPAIPFLIRRRDTNPMAFAAVWETWSGPNGEEMETACIVTTSANKTMAGIHDRMPVILEPEDFDTWLNNNDVDAHEAAQLMHPAAEDVLETIEISTAVNSVRNDGPEVQRPVTARAQTAVQTATPASKKPRSTGPRKPKTQSDLFG